MKKTIVKAVCLVVFTLLSVMLVIKFSGIFDKKLASGKYCIVGETKYPDAYVEVKGNDIQFHNIDLNDIFKEKMIYVYNRLKESHPEDKILDDEYDDKFNINRWLVESSYTIEYDPEFKNQYSTNVYYYYLHSDFDYAVLVMHYDTFHKTITIMSDGIEIKFAK